MTFFSPQLFLPVLQPAIVFYKKAFGAVEINRWDNDDGSTHVAELRIEGALFHLHEEVDSKKQQSPSASASTTTVLLGVFTDDPDKLFNAGVAEGARVLNEMQDYDYGYRQGTIQDPFGHQWMFQKKINPKV